MGLHLDEAGAGPRPAQAEASRVRVLVAEDEELLRAAIADLIVGEEEFELLGTAADADSALELARVLQPDVMLLDVRMPGGGGVRAVLELRRVSPDTRAVALSAYDDRANVLAMLRAGAVGYLVKGAEPSELLEAIRRAARDQASLSRETAADLVVDISRDEAARSEFDEALARSDARFGRMLEAIPDGVVVVEADGKIALANTEALSMFGYTALELLRAPFELLFPERLRARYALQRESWLSDSDARSQKLALEWVGLRKDGSEFPAFVSLSGEESGEGVVLTAFMRDLSPRRAADVLLRKHEKHFEALLDSAPDAVVIVDASGRICYANRQTETLFGYERSELLDRPVEVLVPQRFHEHHHAHRDGYLADPQPRPIGAGLELAGRRRNGTEFAVDISLSGIETSDGQLVAAFVRDVSDRKARTEVERDLATRRAVLAHLVSAGEDERQRIAADIHDDSIQVMTAAGMRLEILERSVSDPEQLAFLAPLQQTIALAISRLRHLLFELRPPVLDHEGLGPALRMYLEVADEQTATSYELDDRLSSQPPEAARLILYRIAQEVLTNVRKHAGAAKAFVTLSCREGGYLVRVVDDGVGFPMGAAGPRPGHLGLAAIRERAELAGGWLRVRSEPGSGTTVEFWVPGGEEAGLPGREPPGDLETGARP
jgi:PAS domain S-box-containing protein